MSEHDNENLAPRVLSLEKQLGNFIKASEEWRVDISRDIRALSEKISDKTAPNLGTMAGWAGVVSAVILGIVTLITTQQYESARRDREESRHSLESESAKYAIALGALRGEFTDIKENGSPVTRDRLARLESRVDFNTVRMDQSKAWDEYQVKSDLEELRTRRLREAEKK